ncbi:MAG: LysR family transcriptional regulator [Pseudoalteromonas prydzensis]|uniref:LysR family transcriptional regulator n=1 Tax=Pseudoalteromonas TaxID=53246 RepID=UPI0039FC09E8
MDKLTAARVFVDVAYSGSFTATAERLEMSRPMVTRNIESVEAWLNTRLLHRTTRKVTLTSAGAACLPEIEQWLAQANSLVLQTQNQHELSGQIRVATSMSLGYAQLVKVFTEFMKRHPKVHIDIDLQDSTTDLIAQRIDLAIRIAANPDPSLIGKPIAVCDSILVASPRYLSDYPPITEPKQLTTHQCLGYKNFDRHVWHLRKQAQFQSVDVKCKLTANEATTLLYAAVHDGGIAVQPNYLADPFISDGRLQQVLPEWTLNPMKIYVLYPSRKHLSATVRALIDTLSAAFTTR